MLVAPLLALLRDPFRHLVMRARTVRCADKVRSDIDQVGIIGLDRNVAERGGRRVPKGVRELVSQEMFTTFIARATSDSLVPLRD